MDKNEFKYQNKNLVGFIPDTSSKISDTIRTTQGNVVEADAAAVIANVYYANQRNIQTNKNYNNGFVRRKNYTIIQLLRMIIFVN